MSTTRENPANLRRVALLGHGAMGQRHAKALRALADRLTFCGIYDADPKALPADLPTFATEAEAIAAADVVFVATPIGAHVGTVLRALAARRAVFVEKPIGATEKEGRAMVAAASRAGLPLLVGHSERFNPVVRALRKAIDPASVEALDFCRIGAPRSRGRDVLLNLGVHDFDLAAHLTDSRAAVRAAFGREDAVEVLLSTQRGCPVRVRVGREGERERRVVVTTRDATYRGDLLRFHLTVCDHASQHERELPLDTEEPLVAQARAVFDALDGKPSAIAHGEDGAEAVRAAEMGLSLLRKRPPVAAPLAGEYAGDSAE